MGSPLHHPHGGGDRIADKSFITNFGFQILKDESYPWLISSKRFPSLPQVLDSILTILHSCATSRCSFSKPAERLFAMNRHLWVDWSQSLETFTHSEVFKERLIWIKISKVRLCCWDPTTLNEIASFFGEEVLFTTLEDLQRNAYFASLNVISENENYTGQQVLFSSASGEFKMWVSEYNQQRVSELVNLNFLVSSKNKEAVSGSKKTSGLFQAVNEDFASLPKANAADGLPNKSVNGHGLCPENNAEVAGDADGKLKDSISAGVLRKQIGSFQMQKYSCATAKMGYTTQGSSSCRMTRVLFKNERFSTQTADVESQKQPGITVQHTTTKSGSASSLQPGKMYNALLSGPFPGFKTSMFSGIKNPSSLQPGNVHATLLAFVSGSFLGINRRMFSG